MRAAITTLRGSRLHGKMCDAFMRWGGFVWLDGRWYEVLGATPDEYRPDAWRWALGAAREVGVA